MSRWIEEADFLIHLVKKPRYSSKTIGEAIDESHSIDIVRCRECKHWREYETWSECERWTGDPYDTAKTNADDFCSYGERREP